MANNIRNFSFEKESVNNVNIEPNTTKNIKNCSLQGLSLIIESPDGTESVWVAPRQSITLPEEKISQQILNLHRRRLVQIS